MKISYEIFKLKNDIKVIYLPRKDTNISCISCFVKVGSIDESIGDKVANTAGMSHFLEHVLFKGTKKRPGPNLIAKELDSVGAYFNAYTDKNLTSFIVKTESGRIEKGIDIISDMLLNSYFNNDDFEKELKIVIEEVNRGKDNPSDWILEKIYEIIYEGHPLAHSIGGTEKIIRNYNIEDLIKHWKNYYTADNIVISISSNLSLNVIKNYLNKSFFPEYKASLRDIKYKRQILKPQTKTKYKIIKNSLEQVHLALGFRVAGMYNDDKYGLGLLKIILAGNMSSRLFIALRTNAALSYNVSVDLSFYEDNGSFIICTSFDKDSLFCKDQTKIQDLDNILENLTQRGGSESELNLLEKGGLTVILDNIRKLKTDLIPKKELTNAKGFLKGHLILENEDAHIISDYFGKQVVFGHKPILNFDYILEKYNKITSRDLLNLCNKYFNKKTLNIAVIGNYGENEIKGFIENYDF